MFERHPRTLSTDYTGRCGNCHELFANDEEKYCTYCGTKRGEGKFEPYDNAIYCIYGPMPEKRTRECVRCGNQWTYTSMLDKEKFCVRCGGQSKLIQDTKAAIYMDDMHLGQPHEVKAVYANCCNKVVPATYSHCPFCGKELVDNIHPSAEDIIIDPDETSWICDCGIAVPLRYRFCGNCGKKTR